MTNHDQNKAANQVTDSAMEEAASTYCNGFGHGSIADKSWCLRDFKAGWQACLEQFMNDKANLEPADFWFKYFKDKE